MTKGDWYNVDEMLRQREVFNSNESLKLLRKWTLYFLLGGVVILGLSFFKTGAPNAIYGAHTILQTAVLFAFILLFKKRSAPSLLLFGLLAATSLYAVEYALHGMIHDPLSDYIPRPTSRTIPTRGEGVGLVKGFSLMFPYLYFWSKTGLGLFTLIVYVKLLIAGQRK